ncbi:hypothetical protein BKA63DRAFT_497406 [Paraphoma chrysanthemicola]|nr:hypothetical protein BKA63DRAFT_497406 [Paraphoma chrysanthemicola]
MYRSLLDTRSGGGRQTQSGGRSRECRSACNLSSLSTTSSVESISTSSTPSKLIFKEKPAVSLFDLRSTAAHARNIRFACVSIAPHTNGRPRTTSASPHQWWYYALRRRLDPTEVAPPLLMRVGPEENGLARRVIAVTYRPFKVFQSRLLLYADTEPLKVATGREGDIRGTLGMFALKVLGVGPSNLLMHMRQPAKRPRIPQSNHESRKKLRDEYHPQNSFRRHRSSRGWTMLLDRKRCVYQGMELRRGQDEP